MKFINLYLTIILLSLIIFACNFTSVKNKMQYQEMLTSEKISSLYHQEAEKLQGYYWKQILDIRKDPVDYLKKSERTSTYEYLTLDDETLTFAPNKDNKIKISSKNSF